MDFLLFDNCVMDLSLYFVDPAKLKNQNLERNPDVNEWHACYRQTLRLRLVSGKY